MHRVSKAVLFFREIVSWVFLSVAFRGEDNTQAGPRRPTYAVHARLPLPPRVGSESPGLRVMLALRGGRGTPLPVHRPGIEGPEPEGRLIPSARRPPPPIARPIYGLLPAAQRRGRADTSRTDT